MDGTAMNITSSSITKLAMGTSNASSSSKLVDMETMMWIRSTYAWMIPCMWVVLTIAIIGNSCIVLSARWLRHSPSPNLRLCLSLAASDLWSAFVMMAGLLINSYIPTVLQLYKAEWQPCFSLLTEIIRLSAMLTSDFHLLAIAFNHLIGIMAPLKYKVIVTTRRLRIGVACLWVVPLVLMMVWFSARKGEGLFAKNCSHPFYFRLPFRLAVFILFIVPLIFTLSVYAFILVHLFRQKALSDLGNTLRRSINYSSGQNALKRKFRVVWTTLLIVGTFMLSWGLCLLYFVSVCIDGCVYIYGQSLSIRNSLIISSVVNALLMAKLACNPLIYAMRINHVRVTVKRMLSSWRMTLFHRKGSDTRPTSAIATCTNNHRSSHAFELDAYSERRQSETLVRLHSSSQT